MQQDDSGRITLQRVAEHVSCLGQAGINSPYGQSLDAQELILRRKVHGGKPFLR